MLIIVFAVLPGICEELFFRGLLLSSFRKKMSPMAAVTLTAFFFAVMHMDLSRFSFTFVMGVILGIVLLYTKNILAPILIHILCNATTLTLGHYLETSSETTMHQILDFVVQYPFIAIPCSLVISGILLKICFRALKP